jgi:hypothetical protein
MLDPALMGLAPLAEGPMAALDDRPRPDREPAITREAAVCNLLV